MFSLDEVLFFFFFLCWINPSMTQTAAGVCVCVYTALQGNPWLTGHSSWKNPAEFSNPHPVVLFYFFSFFFFSSPKHPDLSKGKTGKMHGFQDSLKSVSAPCEFIAFISSCFATICLRVARGQGRACSVWVKEKLGRVMYLFSRAPGHRTSHCGCILTDSMEASLLKLFLRCRKEKWTHQQKKKTLWFSPDFQLAVACRYYALHIHLQKENKRKGSYTLDKAMLVFTLQLAWTTTR